MKLARIRYIPFPSESTVDKCIRKFLISLKANAGVNAAHRVLTTR